ncbi:MAG: signal recognition particle-docking protein FtsY [Firmicutes bacterium]|uniref:Signal recognition particle receptor FtsY n=1 Tax=Candidatus Gallilactobacillus intestinavium TaxID=2840838 RepID=A0A9D9E7G8_9LACO|nr:signal recognition particle-docking protein FtsY [Candidatus Gallilactobacillus intestinavium]
MGLFDIFRRKKKQADEEKPQVANNEAQQSELSAEESELNPVGKNNQDIDVSDKTVQETESDSNSDEQNDNDIVEQETSSENESDVSINETEKIDDRQEEKESLNDDLNSDSSDSDKNNHLEVSADNHSQNKAKDDALSDNDRSETEDNEEQAYDKGLSKSRKTFKDRINSFLANFRKVDDDFFDELEETLIASDVGFNTSVKISDELKEEAKLANAKSREEIQKIIVEKLVDLYDQEGDDQDNQLKFAESGPTVILFVGVNGVGKTTTIGKLASKFKQEGKKVLLAAADTFRAGAIEQLQEWGKRDGVEVVALPEKSDPSAVVFDAIKKVKSEDYDVLLVDTAGRLQNKVNLMNELGKMKRVITREIPDAPHEVLLVLDATTGQNAMNQAKSFKDVTDVTGIVLTKMDSTAKGGIVLAIRDELHLPVKFIGFGEQVNDLRIFNSENFIYNLFKDLVNE